MGQQEHVLPVEYIRARAEAIAVELEAALEHVERARSFVEVFHGELEAGTSDLPRFSFEVMQFVGAMAADLGVEGDSGSEFDLEQLARESRDLIDLVDLAATSREAVAA